VALLSGDSLLSHFSFVRRSVDVHLNCFILLTYIIHIDQDQIPHQMHISRCTCNLTLHRISIHRLSHFLFGRFLSRRQLVHQFSSLRLFPRPVNLLERRVPTLLDPGSNPEFPDRHSTDDRDPHFRIRASLVPPIRNETQNDPTQLWF
jgi:hypothetical protein